MNDFIIETVGFLFFVCFLLFCLFCVSYIAGKGFWLAKPHNISCNKEMTSDYVRGASD